MVRGSVPTVDTHRDPTGDPRMVHGRELRLPDLGAPEQGATLSAWLVDQGSEVVAGDRVVEILVGNATVDLPAPASGVLREVLVAEEEPVATGQLLAIITEVPAASGDR